MWIFYTISNIKKVLDHLDPELFSGFIKIMVFDALVGEQDRHEENWGIFIKDHHYSISPLYDNGCSLLKEFKNENLANDYYNHKKDFDAYIKRSKTYFYKEDRKTRYKHFELIEKLLEDYPEITYKKISNLKRLLNINIWIILAKLPKGVINNIHKQYIYKYVVIRKKILLDMIKRGEK